MNCAKTSLAEECGHLEASLRKSNSGIKEVAQQLKEEQILKETALANNLSLNARLDSLLEFKDLATVEIEELKNKLEINAHLTMDEFKEQKEAFDELEVKNLLLQSKLSSHESCFEEQEKKLDMVKNAKEKALL